MSVRAPGEVGQVLQDVGTHRVVGEVVLDAPQRFESERFGEIAEPQLVAVDVAVRAAVAAALENHCCPDVHGMPPL